MRTPSISSENSNEAQQLSLISEEKKDDIKQTNNPVNSWHWMDKYLLYFPMCTSLKPSLDKNKLIRRNKYFIIFVVFISILLSILLTINAIENFFIHDYENTSYFLNDLLLQISQMIFKLFSLKYFYSFKYPWYSSIDSSQNNAKKDDDLDIKYEDTKIHYIWPQRMCKIMLLLMTVIYIPIIIIKSYFGHIEKSTFNEPFYLSLTQDIIYAYFYWFPIVFTFIIHTFICIKYQYYLSEILLLIKNKNTLQDIHKILSDYKSIYHKFRKDYPTSLQSALQSFLFGTILYFWGFVFNFQIATDLAVRIQYIIVAGLYGIVGSVLMIIMYTVPGSFINKQMKKIEKQLWNVDHYDESIWRFSMHFMNYTKKYYVGIRIGKFVLTYKHVIAFFIVFGATKYMTFTIKSQTIYDSNI